MSIKYCPRSCLSKSCEIPHGPDPLEQSQRGPVRIRVTGPGEQLLINMRQLFPGGSLENKYVSTLLLKSTSCRRAGVLTLFGKRFPGMSAETFRPHWWEQIDLRILFCGERRFTYRSISAKSHQTLLSER